jgi:hypothetical protein
MQIIKGAKLAPHCLIDYPHPTTEWT